MVPHLRKSSSKKVLQRKRQKITYGEQDLWVEPSRAYDTA